MCFLSGFSGNKCHQGVYGIICEAFCHSKSCKLNLRRNGYVRTFQMGNHQT